MIYKAKSLNGFNRQNEVSFDMMDVSFVELEDNGPHYNMNIIVSFKPKGKYYTFAFKDKELAKIEHNKMIDMFNLSRVIK